MKKSIIILFSIIISGCATYSGQSTVNLGTLESLTGFGSIGHGNGSFQIKFINKSSQPVFININKKAPSFRKINPESSWTYHSSSKKEINYTLKWWYRHNNFEDEERRETAVSLTALYDQGEVLIDNNFLRKKSVQKGVVINYFSEPVTIYDSQGNNYGKLETGEWKYGYVVSGQITFYFIKEGNNWGSRKTKSFTMHVDNKENYDWQGEVIGWEFHVN